MSESTNKLSTEQAIEVLLNGWMPFNRSVLESVKTKLSENIEDIDKELLFEELQKDISLLLHLTRELNRDYRFLNSADELSNIPNTVSFNRVHSLEELILNSDIKDIARIVNEIAIDDHAHSFDSMTLLQAIRLQEAAISSSCAEELAYATGMDMDLAYTASQIRQLALALIAWNYPKEYANAIEKLGTKGNLAKKIEEQLGFSPTDIAQKLAERWNLAFDVLAAVGCSEDRYVGSSAFATISDSAFVSKLTLSRICSLSDALARLNFPEQYPTDIKALDSTLTEIFRPLDNKTLTVVYFKAHKYMSASAALCPKGIKFGVPKELRQRIAHSEKLSKLLEKNQHIKCLPEDLKQEIKKLYSKFDPERILKSNINTLVHKIIPKAGFSRGCIYMYEPKKEVLNPAILIGGVSQEKRQAFKVRSSAGKQDLITSSFMMKSPLRESVKSDGGNPGIAIAGALGDSNRVGVLYLESDNHAKILESTEALSAYRAIRQCLSDCFNLT